MADSQEDLAMKQFLLSTEDSPERSGVEDRLVRDPRYFEELEAFEDELILRWHRGDLSADDRQRFSAAYLERPERRAKVEALGALIDAARDYPGPHRHDGAIDQPD